MSIAAQDVRIPASGMPSYRVVKTWQMALVVFLLVAALATGIAALVTRGAGATTNTPGGKVQSGSTQVSHSGGGGSTIFQDDLKTKVVHRGW